MFKRKHIFQVFLRSVVEREELEQRIQLSCTFARFQRALFEFQSNRVPLARLALRQAIDMKAQLSPGLKQAIEAISQHPVTAYGHFSQGDLKPASTEINLSLSKLGEVITSDPVAVPLAQMEQELNLIRIGFRAKQWTQATVHLNLLIRSVQDPDTSPAGLVGNYGGLLHLDPSERREIVAYLRSAKPPGSPVVPLLTAGRSKASPADWTTA